MRKPLRIKKKYTPYDPPFPPKLKMYLVLINAALLFPGSHSKRWKKITLKAAIALNPSRSLK